MNQENTTFYPGTRLISIKLVLENFYAPPLYFICKIFRQVLPCNRPEFHKGHRPINFQTTACATSKDLIRKLFPFLKTGGKI